MARSDRNDLVAQEVQETGGQVLEAEWLDGTIWRDAPSGIKGSITQRGNDRPIAHAIVALVGTSDTVETDERGQFAFRAVVPGKYMVEVTDTTLSAFTAPRSQSRAVEVARGTVSDFHASLPPVGDVILRLCKDNPSERLTTIVAGRVALPKGIPPDRLQIQASWQADFSGYYGVSVSIETAMRTISVDDAGRFAICKVSVDRPLKLKLVLGGVLADTTVVPPEGPYTIVNWRPWQSPPASKPH